MRDGREVSYRANETSAAVRHESHAGGGEVSVNGTTVWSTKETGQEVLDPYVRPLWKGTFIVFDETMGKRLNF